MKSVDLTPLFNNDEEFAKSAETVSDKFKCDWDDIVHDSYSVFVKHIEDCSKQIHSVRCKAETLVKEEAALKVDDVISSSDLLCKEVESI